MCSKQKHKTGGPAHIIWDFAWTSYEEWCGSIDQRDHVVATDMDLGSIFLFIPVRDHYAQNITVRDMWQAVFEARKAAYDDGSLSITTMMARPLWQLHLENFMQCQPTHPTCTTQLTEASLQGAEPTFLTPWGSPKCATPHSSPPTTHPN